MASYFKIQDDTDENESCIPSLGLRERLIGFFVCLGLGNY